MFFLPFLLVLVRCCEARLVDGGGGPPTYYEPWEYYNNRPQQPLVDRYYQDPQPQIFQFLEPHESFVPPPDGERLSIPNVQTVPPAFSVTSDQSSTTQNKEAEFSSTSVLHHSISLLEEDAPVPGVDTNDVPTRLPFMVPPADLPPAAWGYWRRAAPRMDMVNPYVAGNGPPDFMANSWIPPSPAFQSQGQAGSEDGRVNDFLNGPYSSNFVAKKSEPPYLSREYIGGWGGLPQFPPRWPPAFDVRTAEGQALGGLPPLGFSPPSYAALPPAPYFYANPNEYEDSVLQNVDGPPPYLPIQGEFPARPAASREVGEEIMNTETTTTTSHTVTASEFQYRSTGDTFNTHTESLQSSEDSSSSTSTISSTTSDVTMVEETTTAVEDDEVACSAYQTCEVCAALSGRCGWCDGLRSGSQCVESFLAQTCFLEGGRYSTACPAPTFLSRLTRGW